MKKGKYLITGCAGFIGSNLVEQLRKKYNLILVDDLSEGSKNNLPKSSRNKIIKKKIQNLKNFKINNLKGIIHLAAQSSVPLSVDDFFKSSTNNIVSSLKVFEIAKNNKVPVVYASSSAIYGNLPIGDDIKNKFSISSPYAQDKLSLEYYAKMFFDVFNISSIGLRFFNVYGPKQKADSPYSAVIPIFINRMKKNLPVIINGGFQTRDFIFIDDVIKIIEISMGKVQSKKINNIFNVGTGRSININYLFKLIKKQIPNKSKVIKKSLDKFDPKISSGSFLKLKKILKNKRFNFTKLEHGIIKTISSLK
jgi:UDP-glucose 4-epimerase